MSSGANKRSLEEEPLPEGWTEKISRSRGIPYYVNDYNPKDTVWERPVKKATKSDSIAIERGTMSGEEAGARHILRKHRDSRRPSSWRAENITQSKAEAIDEIEAYREKLLKAHDEGGYEEMEKLFIAIATTDSDCGSAKQGGDLGMFGRVKMQKQFEDATFSLTDN
jgi:NIMA-interacting peptidyl-prolyl cis-trans isomerase 1